MKSLMLKGLSLVFLIIGLNSVYAQQNATLSEKNKNFDKHRTVYFDIVGIGNNQLAQEMALERMFQDPEVFDGEMMPSAGNNVRCRIEVSMNVSVEYISNMLDDLGLKIDVDAITNSLLLNQAKIYTSEFKPVLGNFIDWDEYLRDNKNLSREEYYLEKKKEWVEKIERVRGIC